jgi:hypothetical protein
MRYQDWLTIMSHALISAAVLEGPERYLFHVSHYEAYFGILVCSDQAAGV